MAKKFKKTYRFAAFTSGYITVTLFLLATGVFFYFRNFSFWWILLFGFICYWVCFFIIQHRVEKFIYKRIQKIYDDISLLDASNLSSQPITTNIKTLTREIERFAHTKKLEIEALKIRETYRKEFIGNVSHELKTPLFTVQGYLLTLLDGALEDKNVSEKYLKRANKGVERLVYIVKDLDMISKFETGDLNLNRERFDIIDLIQNVFDLLEMKAQHQKVTLTFDKSYKSKFAFADKERIRQVITNLLVNAIKYSKEKGTVEVSIEELTANNYLIRITDNGIGIKQEELTRIFERFYRVDKSGSRERGGSGLGLAIVKHIIEAHNQKIYVESQFGVGSEFSFTLEKAK